MHKGTWCRYEGVYVASSQRSAVLTTVYVHILVAETGFERGVGSGKVKNKRDVCINIRPLHTQGRTYIDKMCKKSL